jgi:hypothetical protein
MKKAVITIILGLLILARLNAQINITFPIKSGTIIYSSIGLGNGVSTLYFNDYGKILCEDYVGTIWEQDVHTRTIIKGGKLFVLDMNENTHSTEDMQEIKAKIIDEYYFNEEGFEKKGFVKERQESILGKNCTVYSQKKEYLVKVWVWQGLILKKEDDLLGGSLIFASEIKENEPDKNIFEIPSVEK